jgi:DNA-binding MarR family transcriptional regulator
LKKSIGRLVSVLHRQSQIYINNALKDLNISSAEYSFLFCLDRMDGITQEEMSAYLYIDKSATARAIKSLEQKGYVIRKKDMKDKRINRVFLTDKAKENMTEIRNRVFRWSEFLTEDLDTKTADIIYSTLEAMVIKVEYTKKKNETEENPASLTASPTCRSTVTYCTAQPWLLCSLRVIGKRSRRCPD